MNKIRNVIYCLLFLLPFFWGCNTKDVIFIKDFDNIDWKNDSLACKGYRKANYEKIVSHEKEILNRSDESILDLLGVPNQIKELENGKCFYYFIHEGNQCIKNNINSLDIINNSVLKITFNINNKTEDVNVIVP